MGDLLSAFAQIFTLPGSSLKHPHWIDNIVVLPPAFARLWGNLMLNPYILHPKTD